MSAQAPEPDYIIGQSWADRNPLWQQPNTNWVPDCPIDNSPHCTCTGDETHG